ncbi:MAG: hypothetical protein ACOYKN_03390 [Pirellula sp.]
MQHVDANLHIFLDVPDSWQWAFADMISLKRVLFQDQDMQFGHVELRW